MLHEWYHPRNPKDLLEPCTLFILKNLVLSSDNPDGAEPVPDSVLINGKGRFDCSKTSEPDCIPNSPYHVFNVNPMETYKLR